MITWGGAVAGIMAGIDVTPIDVVVDQTTEDDVLVVSGARPDRLMSDATMDPVTEARPMIAAAMMGPHFVRLMRPALATVAAPMIASEGGVAGVVGRAAGGGGAWLSSALTPLA